jgi:hypothetical protein
VAEVELVIPERQLQNSREQRSVLDLSCCRIGQIRACHFCAPAYLRGRLSRCLSCLYRAALGLYRRADEVRVDWRQRR